MRQVTRWAGLALVLSSALASAAPGLRAEDDKVTGDLKKMQGSWVNAKDDAPESKWVFEGETLKSTVHGQEYTCKVVVDAKATPHSTIDLTIQEGPGDSVGKSSKSIYKFEDKKLIVCVSFPGIDTRPVEFKSVDDEAMLFELKKEQ